MVICNNRTSEIQTKFVTHFPLLDTRNSHYPHEVHPYSLRYQSLVAATKVSPIQNQPQKQKQPRAVRAKPCKCATLTRGKAFTGKIWKKVKGALHIPVSLADGCSSLVPLGRMVLLGSLPSVCGDSTSE